jgi:hypothetical protein
MRIKTQQLVSPFSIVISFLFASLSISGLVMAEADRVNSVVNASVNTEVIQKLVTPQLKDAQAAFNTGNYDLAFSLWQTRATQGHSDAQVFVGLSYANGWGVDKSIKLASHWYQKAANGNNASGQFLFGLYLISGKDADLPKGVMWLRRAAENGDTSAQGFLKKAERRGWFDKVPEIKQEKGNEVETIAMADQAKL